MVGRVVLGNGIIDFPMRVFYTPYYYAKHQGNGTATIFSNDPYVFTFSMHGAKNYPLFKARSSLDIGLPDGTADGPYLDALESNLASVFAIDPEIVFYLGGADPYIGDKLGRLSLSIEGLRRRDEVVLEECYRREVPVVTVMSGGYGENLADTVEIHCNTIRTVCSIFGMTALCEERLDSCPS